MCKELCVETERGFTLCAGGCGLAVCFDAAPGDPDFAFPELGPDGRFYCMSCVQGKRQQAARAAAWHEQACDA